ncbi:MAG TPA: TonB family protein [Pyrinomonadaceae bacterium]|nr:TonB family protein [Pyrinomonadaceae bacterium]
MKVCPLCGRDYVDELGYCLEDGTPLTAAEKITERKTEEFGEPTFVRPAQTVAASPPVTQPRSSNKLGVLLVVGILLAGLLVLLGAGVAGILFYAASKNEVVRSGNVNQGNSINEDPFGNANVSNKEAGVNANANPTASPVSNTQKPTPTPSTDRKPTPANSLNNDDPADVKPDKTPAAPKTVSGGVLNAKAISLPKPPYPPAAKAVRASGAVTVQVLIDEDGNVVSATAVSGHPLLRAAAVAAARGARFTPTSLGGQRVKVSGVITYNFVP